MLFQTAAMILVRVAQEEYVNVGTSIHIPLQPFAKVLSNVASLVVRIVRCGADIAINQDRLPGLISEVESSLWSALAERNCRVVVLPVPAYASIRRPSCFRKRSSARCCSSTGLKERLDSSLIVALTLIVEIKDQGKAADHQPAIGWPRTRSGARTTTAPCVALMGAPRHECRSCMAIRLFLESYGTKGPTLSGAPQNSGAEDADGR